MMTPEQAVVAAILLCLGGALATLVCARCRALAGWLAFAVTAASAVLVVPGAWQVLQAGPGEPASFFAMPRLGLALRLHVDGLTAVFLLLVATIATPAALYAVRYMDHYPDYGVGRYYPYCLLFLAAMYGLVSTTDMMWFFCIFWQMMTLPGYALIRFEHRKRANVRAANRFLLMMQIACAATMVGAEVLAGGSAAASGEVLRYDFANVSRNLPALLVAHPGLAALAFALFLVGFGIKMGMWPFGQFWLPDAHPAAPSPVSAMLSGVMIKTGVYGLVRYFVWLVPPAARDQFPLATWGWIVAALGTITLFTGTMQALRQEQSKRLLAFHSIGQIGYILLGFGVCLALLPVAGATGRGAGMAGALAAVGMLGALFHVLNHGVFKALLFLNAGSMLYATGSQNLNKMGGLLKYLPVTGATALVASFSISGVPLFSGFASKWTIYVAAVQGAAEAKYLAVCAVIAILTSALTLASFIKFFGASFLCRTSALVRGKIVAGSGRERLGEGIGPLMLVPQLFLAGLCVTVGVVPALGLNLLQRGLAASSYNLGALLAGAGETVRATAWVVAGPGGTAVIAPLAVLVLVAVLFVLVRGLSKLGAAPRRAAAPWLCGYVGEAECYRYHAHGYYGEIKRHFRWLGGAPAAMVEDEAEPAAAAGQPQGERE